MEESKVNKMINWFYEVYEDPAESVTYISREGGYQYFADEPYDAREVLQEEYPEEKESLIEQAVEIITEEGHEWVKKDRG